MCFFGSLVDAMFISNEASYRIGGYSTGYFTETKPAHAIRDDPQFFLLVTRSLTVLFLVMSVLLILVIAQRMTFLS